jgi:hypothetical protein
MPEKKDLASLQGLLIWKNNLLWNHFILFGNYLRCELPVPDALELVLPCEDEEERLIWLLLP